jgi:hypothetical protein
VVTAKMIANSRRRLMERGSYEKPVDPTSCTEDISGMSHVLRKGSQKRYGAGAASPKEARCSCTAPSAVSVLS